MLVSESFFISGFQEVLFWSFLNPDSRTPASRYMTSVEVKSTTTGTAIEVVPDYRTKNEIE